MAFTKIRHILLIPFLILGQLAVNAQKISGELVLSECG